MRQTASVSSSAVLGIWYGSWNCWVRAESALKPFQTWKALRHPEYQRRTRDNCTDGIQTTYSFDTWASKVKQLLTVHISEQQSSFGPKDSLFPRQEVGILVLEELDVLTK